VLKVGQTVTELTDKLIGYTVRAGVNQAVYGKQAGSFGDAFVNSFVTSAAADAAMFIGDNAGVGKPLGEMGSPRHVLAHAAVGCAAAALSGRDCASGAIGGGTSALAGSFLPDPQGQAQKALMAGALTFAGGAVVQAAGYDGATAAQAAQNEALNNRLLHQKEIAAIKQRARQLAGKDGLSAEEWEARLGAQALRQVNWASQDGNWDDTASDYLRELKGFVGALPNAQGKYTVTAFYAIPDQKADTTLYANTFEQNAQFYQNAANSHHGRPAQITTPRQDAQARGKAATLTVGAAAAGVGLLAVGIGPSVVGACLTNPVVCNQIGVTTAEVFSEGGVVAGGVALAGKASALRIPEAVGEVEVANRTTVLGENMLERVIPFAEETGARTLPFGTTAERWATLTPKERWKLNDGALRTRIGEGDNFQYIGRDPYRDPLLRQLFDLTGSEILRLESRGTPYQIIPLSTVEKTIGRR